MWWKDLLIYEVYIDKFAKNISGLTSKLDYLQDLGINCIWVLPHYKSPMTDDGYDISDYKSIRPELGTLEEFENFTKDAHKKNLKVIIDLVLNHTSIEHKWFSQNPNLYIWTENPKEIENAFKPFDFSKKDNWVYDNIRKKCYYSTFYATQPDLNWDNPEVFEKFCDIIDFWCSRGVNGFRLDAITHLYNHESDLKTKNEKTHAVIKKLRSYLEKKHPEVILMGEVDVSLDEAKEYFGEGDECHLLINFNLTNEMWKLMLHNKFAFDKELEKYKNIPKNCDWVNFLTNHDTLPFHMLSKQEQQTLGTLVDPNLKYSNGLGEFTCIRLAEVFKKNPENILNAFKLLFSTPGAKCIYYGEEIGMKNAKLAKTPKDKRKYVRGKFEWDKTETQLPEKIKQTIKQ